MAVDKKVGYAKTALIVDDNPLIRAHLCDLFLSAGFAFCREAATGCEAIELAREYKPDLIILDLVMPAMNGVEAAPRLRELLPETPIILYTLFADQLKRVDLRLSGVSAVFLKSEPPHQLLAKAQELMGSSYPQP
jgi:CheY-like chemotaxis protein